jgi:hypothetical protein
MTANMTIHKQVTYFLLAVAAMFILPFAGALVANHGSLPATFFNYPPVIPYAGVPSFNWIVFGISASIGLLIALIYIMPTWFGFKKTPVPSQTPVQPAMFPPWFWVGLAFWGIPVALLWSKAVEPRLLLVYSDLPIFWGFTFIIDGFVYRRSGGHSIIGEKPTEMCAIGIASISGWMIFEFLNFFIHMNWYYPFGLSNGMTQSKFLLYALIGSSGLLPMAFEWYDLLLTFPWLRYRYSSGVKIILPLWARIVLFIAALAAMFLMGLYPAIFFCVVWLSPLLILTILLGHLGIWTPFTAIKTGNWAPFMVFALAYLGQGLAMECWNYFSGTHSGGVLIATQTPAYWVYHIPYVYRFRIFEMPLVGYLGYLPFSVYCWIWWIVFAYMQGIPTRFYQTQGSV